MRRTIRFSGFALTLAVAMSILTADIYSQTYTVVDLGTLGGHASGGDGLNDLGQVVGWSIDDPYAYYGFISAAGGPPLTSLGSPPNGDYSYAQAVNNLGQVVGFGEVTVGFGEDDHAFIWQNGVMTDLGTFGGNASQAWAINDASQVVGWAEDEGPGKHAFIWENGVMTELPGFPGEYPESEAHGINEAGIAVGFSWDANPVRQAVVWENGLISMSLELPQGATGAKAYAINDLNQVAGNTWGAGGATTAILWDQAGNATILPPIKSHYYNVAYGINNSSQVVGHSYSGGHLSSTSSPVLWENGIAFELDDLVPPESGLYGFNAYEINSSGQIAATGSGSGGFVAVRLDPVPGTIGLTGPDPGYTGQESRLAVRGATPGELIYFLYGLAEGSSDVPGCPGLTVGIDDARLLGSSVVDENGHAVISGLAPPVLSGRTVYFQAVEHSSCRVANLTSHPFL